MIDLDKLRKSKGHVLAIVNTKTGEYEPLKDDVIIIHPEDFNFVKLDYGNSYPYPLPCENCSNNPKNGGGGVCHCVLGQQVIY